MNNREGIKAAMRFTWTGLILAPFLVALIFSAAMLGLLQGSSPALLFVFLMVPSCVVAYGTTIFLFLPSLFLLSSWRPLTGFRVCLLGLLLGAGRAAARIGPPTESFVVFFLRWAADPMTAIYPLAGLMTAGLYWRLGTWRRARQ